MHTHTNVVSSGSRNCTFTSSTTRCTPPRLHNIQATWAVATHQQTPEAATDAGQKCILCRLLLLKSQKPHLHLFQLAEQLALRGINVNPQKSAHLCRSQTGHVSVAAHRRFNACRKGGRLRAWPSAPPSVPRRLNSFANAFSSVVGNCSHPTKRQIQVRIVLGVLVREVPLSPRKVNVPHCSHSKVSEKDYIERKENT